MTQDGSVGRIFNYGRCIQSTYQTSLKSCPSVADNILELSVGITKPPTIGIFSEYLNPCCVETTLPFETEHQIFLTLA